MPFLFATVLLDLIGFGIIIPILPFMAPTLGASNFDIAMLIAVYSLCGALIGPFWGRLSDRIGRKPVLLICLAGAALSYVLLAFASTLALLYASRILAGLMAGNFAVASAMVADISAPDKRARNMGLLGAAFGLGLVIGPAMGGVLAGEDGRYLLVGLVAAGLSLAAMLAGAVMVKESLSPAQRKQHHEERNLAGQLSLLSMLRNTRNSMLVGQFFLANNCHTTVSYLFPLWVGAYLGWSAKEVGLVFGIQGLAMAVLQSSLIGHMVRVLGERWVLVMGTALMSTGFTILALANSQHMILAGLQNGIDIGAIHLAHQGARLGRIFMRNGDRAVGTMAFDADHFVADVGQELDHLLVTHRHVGGNHTDTADMRIAGQGIKYGLGTECDVAAANVLRDLIVLLKLAVGALLAVPEGFSRVAEDHMIGLAGQSVTQALFSGVANRLDHVHEILFRLHREGRNDTTTRGQCHALRAHHVIFGFHRSVGGGHKYREFLTVAVIVDHQSNTLYGHNVLMI